MGIVKAVALAILSLIAVHCVAHGQTIQSAQEAYWAGDFQKSAQHYRALVGKYPNNGDLWYNVGTAEAQAGRLGYAVFALEQALILNPDDQSAAKNLERVRSRIIDDALKNNASDTLVLPGSDDLGTGLLSAISRDGLRWVFGITWPLLLLIVIFAARSTRPSRRTAFSFSGVVLSLIVLSSGGLLIAKAYIIDHGKFGVLVQDKTVARRGPGAQYAKQAILAAGVKVTLAGTDRKWQQVTLPNGMGAWVKSSDVTALSQP